MPAEIDLDSQLADAVRARLLSIDAARTGWSASDVGPILAECLTRLSPTNAEPAALTRRVLNDLVGLGPLEPLMADHTVTEILVNGPDAVFVERAGKLEAAAVSFRNERHLRGIVERLLSLAGETAHEQRPHAEGSLPDGSRFHLVLPPMAPRGPLLAIRRFPSCRLTMEDLTGPCRTLPVKLGEFLLLAVRNRTPVVISGGAGAGKTTLLGALTSGIPPEERVITLETTAELRLDRPDWAALECVPEHAPGSTNASLRDLLRHALRLRPDRLIVGECLGPEAFDLLQAMNTGHEGVMTTVHASSAAGAVERLYELALTAGVPLPPDTLRRQLEARLGLIVHVVRAPDSTRQVLSVGCVTRSSFFEVARRTSHGWTTRSSELGFTIAWSESDRAAANRLLAELAG